VLFVLADAEHDVGKGCPGPVGSRFTGDLAQLIFLFNFLPVCDPFQRFLDVAFGLDREHAQPVLVGRLRREMVVGGEEMDDKGRADSFDRTVPPTPSAHRDANCPKKHENEAEYQEQENKKKRRAVE